MCTVILVGILLVIPMLPEAETGLCGLGENKVHRTKVFYKVMDAILVFQCKTTKYSCLMVYFVTPSLFFPCPYS